MTEVALRAATTDDVDFLYHLHRAAMQAHVVHTWGYWDEAWQWQHFQQHFDPSACRIVVLHGQDIGAIRVARRVTDIDLSSIELLPAYQGQGIGTHLLFLEKLNSAGWKMTPLLLRKYIMAILFVSKILLTP